MKRKKKIAFSPQEFWDVTSVQNWLEWEARQGWRITGHTGWFCTFGRTEPKESRVRLQPQGPESNEAYWDRIALYEEMGWQHEANLGLDFGVYYCDDPDAPELDTDPEVYALAWKKPVRKGMWSGFGLLLAAAFILVLPFFYAEGFVGILMRADFRLLFAEFLLGPFLVLMALRQIRRANKARKALAAGVMPAGGNWRSSRNWWRAFAVMMLSWLLVASALELVWAMSLDQVDTTGMPYVPYTELAPETSEEDWDLDWRAYVNTCRPLAPDQCVTAFTTKDQKRVQNTQERLLVEVLAKAQYDARRKGFLKAESQVEITEVREEAFDEAVLLQSQDGEQMLLVRRDCVVYSLWVNFPVDLENWIEPVAAEILVQ